MSKKADEAVWRLAREFGKLGNIMKHGIVFVSGAGDGRVALLLPALEEKSLRRTMGWYGRTQSAVTVSEYDLPRADQSFFEFLQAHSEMRETRESPRPVEESRPFFLNGKDALTYTPTYAAKMPLKIAELDAIVSGHRIRIIPQVMDTLARAWDLACETGHEVAVKIGVPDGETLVIDFKSGDPAVESRGFHLRFEQPVVPAPWEDFRQYTRAIGGDTPIIVKPHAGSLNRALARAINESKQSSKVATYVELSVGQSITAAPLADVPVDDGVVRDWDTPHVEQMAASYDVKTESISARIAEPFTVFVEGEVLKKIIGVCGRDVQLGFSPEPGSPIAVWGNNHKFAVLTAKKKEG